MAVSEGASAAAPAGPATAEEPAQDPAARRHALRVLALSSLGAFVVFLDTTIVNVAFETIGRSFHATAGHLAWVLNAYSLVFAAVLIPAGRLADRYGRKRVFLIGITGFAAMSALCGLAPNAGLLIAGRALQAAFAALVTPTSLSLILPEFPAARRPVAIGTWGSMGAAAAALGPTLGALLTQYASWRWIFLVNVPICAVIAFFGLRLLREARDPHAHGLPDPLGVLLIAATPAALSLGIIEGPNWGWSDPRVIGAFVLAALLLPAFVLRDRATAQPVMDFALFRVRQFRLVNAATLLFAAAFYGMLLSNIIFLQTVWHYSVLRAALATAPSPLVVTAVARTASRLSHTHGARRILTFGALFWTAGLTLTAVLAGATPHWTTHWLPAALLTGLGVGLTLPVQSGAAVQALSPGRFALGSAINASLRQLGAVLGISLFVAVLGTPTAANAVDSFHRVWWLLAALGLASGALLWTPGRGRADSDTGAAERKPAYSAPEGAPGR
ncbi:MFS transporter [Streptomyces sp. NPDC054804]